MAPCEELALDFVLANLSPNWRSGHEGGLFGVPSLLLKKFVSGGGRSCYDGCASDECHLRSRHRSPLKSGCYILDTTPALQLQQRQSLAAQPSPLYP